ncbi:MAG: peptide chain release factor N(5)-glutamine methyltransferase [Pyrinomonadaceae bacterium]
MKLSEAISRGDEELVAAGIPEPAREAISLLQFVIARDRAFIIAHPEYELTDREAELFQNSIVRRAAREPYQHIVGRQEFYGLDFLVTHDVLIPRPETELIVERAIELLSNLPSPRFLEIGIGSGCISVAILKHCPKATALAVDISEPAIEIAGRNAAMHGVSDRLEILPSNVFENVPEEKFDLIVSNPPYVPLAEYNELQPEVREHDPKIAVTDGSTGLTIIERIVAQAPMFLTSRGHLLMEIGHGQNEHVKALFDSNRWRSVGIILDLQGIPRTVDAEAA